jgi:sugar lactone lactonase YvrE
VDVISTEAYPLGEGPRLDPRTGELLWVDIRAGRLHRAKLAGGALTELVTHDVGMPCGAVAPLVDNAAGWVLAAGRGFHHLTADGSLRGLRPDVAAPGTLMNDGACDPAGRFVAGSQVLDGGKPGSGALYRLGIDQTVATTLTGIGCSNGISWSPGGDMMFYVDSRARRLAAYRYDTATGAAHDGRTLATFEGTSPDGLCVDDDGCVWLAEWDGWRVRRFDPTGQLLATIELPVPRPTAVCLIGTTLVVTTASYGLDETTRARAPLSGRIFAVDVTVGGPPATPWAGTLPFPADHGYPWNLGSRFHGYP